jgi:hypothetical protein
VTTGFFFHECASDAHEFSQPCAGLENLEGAQMISFPSVSKMLWSFCADELHASLNYFMCTLLLPRPPITNLFLNS